MNRTPLQRLGVYALFGILYLVSTVPVGLLIYSLKTEAGIDIFKPGGFHSYVQCLDRSFPNITPKPAHM